MRLTGSGPEKNRHGPSKQNLTSMDTRPEIYYFSFIIIHSHQHGHRTGDLLFFIYYYLFSSARTPDRRFIIFLFIIIYSHQHGHQAGLPPWWNLRRPVQKRWDSVAAL